MNSRLKLLALIGAIVVGALTALQSRMNGGLAALTHHGIEAAVVSFGSGFLILTVLLIFMPGIRRGLAKIPGAIRSGELKWWQILGGLIGGAFVAVQSTTVPILGVAVFTVAMVAGQSTNSLIVDRIGLGPAGRQTISGARVLAAVIAVVAVAIAVSDRFGTATFSVVAILAAFIGGLAIAVQQAINGRVGRASGHPLSATWLNFAFGVSGLVTTMVILAISSDFDPVPLPNGPIWLYLGGAVGVVFIGTAAWAVQIIGVLLFALASIAGQLAGALILDVILPTSGSNVGWHLVVGVLLTGVAVAIAALGPKFRRSARMGT